MKLSHSLPFTFTCFVVLLTASAFGATYTYTMVDIGAPHGDAFAVPRAINATGQITGATGAGGDSPDSAVFVYGGGSFTVLGTLGGNSGIGNAINSSGQVSGYSQNASGAYRAFISSGDSLIDIGDLGGGSAVAYGINDSGQVVGSAVTADGSNHPFLYSNGQMIDLGTLGSPEGSEWWNSAEGVNNSGVVTGYGYTQSSGLAAFTWSNGKMTQLPSLGADWTEAYAINNKGQVTGISANKKGYSHAYIANPDGTIKDLGVLGGKYATSWGFAINDSGVVVGQVETDTGNYEAFIYNGTRMQSLNALVKKIPGITLIDARGINNAGQIVCTGEDASGNLHTMLLTPRQ
jgi:probable HAF family extracellular repeat protein